MKIDAGSDDQIVQVKMWRVRRKLRVPLPLNPELLDQGEQAKLVHGLE